MGGDRFAVVLEFEFLSRIIAFMQSMTWCRCERSLPHAFLSQHIGAETLNI